MYVPGIVGFAPGEEEVQACDLRAWGNVARANTAAARRRFKTLLTIFLDEQ